MRKRDLRVIFTVSGGWAGRPLAPRSIGYDSTYELDGGWISANCSATQWNPTRHEGVLNLNDGVTAIGGGQSTDYSPFYDRNDVTGVDLSQSKIRTIGDYTFYGCTGLETIDIPSTVNEIGDYAFDCENLTAVICRATVPPALGSHNFTNENDFLYVPEGSVEAYQNDEDWSGAFLRIYPIGYVQHTIRYNAETAVSGNWVADNTDTGLNEFDEETGDGVLYLNTGVTSIGGGQSTDYSPFYNKTDLVSVDLDDSGITNIDRFTFNGCTSLASFDFPSGLTEVGGYAFNGCTALTSIVIPEGIVTVRGSAFRGCSSLASVSFPSTLTTIGGNSFRGTALTSVTIPSGVTLIDPYAFDCASLTTVTCNATTPPVLESNNFTATGDTLYVPYASLEAYENDTDWSSAFTSIRPIGYTYITVGAGEHGSATGSGWYQVDAYVIITATADEHYHFDRWNDGNTSNPRAIIVGSTDTTYTASFAVDEFTLIATGDAHTTVTGSGTYPYGTEVQITATPAEHYHFTSWSDGDTTNPRTVTVTGNMTLSATSAINTYTITVSAGQHGTATGSGTYPYGSFVQISATADSDYHFSQWNDGNTDNPRTITVTADATYTASFESDSYTITVNASGHGTATGSGTYPYGTQVQISATADTYYRFTAWNDGNTDNPRTVTVTGNATYTASIEAMRTISYNAGTAVSGNWVDNNTETALNSYDSQTGDGVLYLKAGVTSIGNGSDTDYTPFYQKTDLVSVDLDDSGLTTIDRYAFFGCTALVDADIPSSVTTINSFAFRNCSSLTSLAIPSSVTTIGGSVWVSCSALTSISVASGNTAFNDGNGSNCIIQTSNNTLKVGCKNTVIPNNVTYIGEAAFSGMGLTSITIPSGVTSIGSYAFYNSVTTVTCLATTPPTLGTNNFNRGGDMLYVPYASLSSYQNDSNWRTVFTSIRPIDYSYITVTAGANGSASGSGWYEIGTTATISATADTGYEFSQWNDGNTDNPRTITVTADATYTASFEIDAFTVTITGDAHTTVTGSGSYPYGTQVQITATPDEHYHFVAWSDGDTNTTRTITVTGDISLSASSAIDTYTIIVSAGDHGTVTGSGTYPYGTSVQISATPDTGYEFSQWNDGNTDNPRTITVTGNATYTASFEAAVQSNVIRYNAGTAVSGNWVTNNTDTTKNTYDSVTGDGVLYLNSGVTSIGGGQSTDYSPFYNKTNLYSADLSNSGLTTVGSRTFYSCSGLTSVQLPSGMTSMGANVFRSCSSLTSVNIPVGITAIQDVCFGDCTSLSSVVLPEGLTTINLGAFTRDTALTAIELPSSITSIGQSSFNCSNLTSVTCKATTPPTLNMNGSTPNFPASNDTLYVPYASLSLYQSSNIWSGAFASIRPIGYSYITVSAGQHGSVSGTGWYQIGTTATITATPDTGYEFSQWNDGNTDNPRSVTVGSTDDTYTASFEAEVINVIRYNSSTEATGGWVTNNTNTTRNTYDSVTGDGVLYLNPSVTSIGGTASTVSSPFYNGNSDSSLKSVDLSDSLITNIGNYTFNNCSGLTTIVYPSGLTTIGNQVFNNCGLTEITIPSGVTSIGNIAYNGCSSATTISIPSTVTSIGDRAFCYCTGITSIEFPEGITTLGTRVCDGDTGLTSVILPSTITSIGENSFRNCSALTSVTCKATSVPTLSTGNFGISGDTLYVPAASVSAYQSATAWSSAFTTITAIPTPVQHTISYTTGDPQWGASAVNGNWVTNNTDTTQNTYATVAGQYGNIGEGVLYLNSGVTTIGGGQSTDYSPFYESSINHQTSTIDLSNSGLTSIGDYGLYDSSVEFDPSNPLVIPEGVTTIGDHALGASGTGGNDCYYDLPSTLTSIASNGIYIGGSKGGIAVMVCRATTPPTLGTNSISAPDGLWELQVPAASVSAYQSSAWGSLGFTTITAIVIPSQIRYNAPTAVSGDWVTNNTDTTRNTYDSVTGNGVLYLNSGVTTIGGGSSNTYSPFYYKSDLVSVDLSDSGLTSIDKRAFMSCASMASITLPDGLTTIGNFVFVDCSSLTSINIPSTVTSISSNAVFYSCTALASITVASGNSVYNDGNGSNCIIRSNAFTHVNTLIYGCKNTVMPNNLNAIATYAFAGCTGLTSITIPSGVSVIAGGAFAECTGLTSITIPNSVTSIGVSDSGHGAFENCSGLVSLTIGSGVTSIGASAFDGCGSLVNVTCYATTPPTLYNGNFTADNDTLKVPSASVSAYQSATAWAYAFTTITSI